MNIDTIFTHPTTTTTTEQDVVYVDCGTYATAGHSLVTFHDQNSNTDSHFVDLNCDVNNFAQVDEGT